MTWRPELPDMFTTPTPIAADAPVRLRVEVDYERLRFAFRAGGGDWQWLPEQFDAMHAQGIRLISSILNIASVNSPLGLCFALSILGAAAPKYRVSRSACKSIHIVEFSVQDGYLIAVHCKPVR
jgi:hypothetical protein